MTQTKKNYYQDIKYKYQYNLHKKILNVFKTSMYNQCKIVKYIKKNKISFKLFIKWNDTVKSLWTPGHLSIVAGWTEPVDRWANAHCAALCI